MAEEQAHVALYRKYRPQRFSDVIGQEHITDVLQYQVTHDRVAHAYMFTGSRGTGKTTCARILAKAINCLNPVNGDPCGECENCKAIEKGLAPDIVEINAGSATGVDDMRALLDTVVYAPALLKRRVIILDEVHMLTANASNALLKTIEEPPEHTVFILATTDVYKVITTILSRCQRFDFRRLPLAPLTTRLLYIAEQEHIVLETPAAQRIARLAQGGMRDAIQMFELCASGGADVTMDRVENYLGVSDYDKLYRTACIVAAGDIRSVFAITEEINASAKDINVFWQELVSFYRDMLVSKYCADPAEYFDLTEQEEKLVTDAAARFTVPQLHWHGQVLNDTLQAMNRMPQMKRTLAEFALIRMCDPHLNTTPDALNTRLTALEDRLALQSVAPSVTPSAPAAAPVSPQDRAAPAPQVRPAATVSSRPVEQPQERFDILADKSELADKIDSMGDKQLKSFLNLIDIYVSQDGTRVRADCDSFSYMLLCQETTKKTFAQALALCQITSGIAAIEVRQREGKKETSTGATESWFGGDSQ